MIVFRRFLVVLLLIELLVFLAPFVLPSAWYYHFYLGDESAEKLTTFYQGTLPSIQDDRAGWKNQPGFNQDLWAIDQWGARTHKPVPLEKTDAVRVLVLGNSLMNGSNTLAVEESISYYLDQLAEQDGKTIEVMNFANMAFNAGQNLAHLRHNLLQFKPDYVVLGLSATAHAGLDNLFLPFYLLDQRNMPYVKPGFFNDNGALKVIDPPHNLVQSDPQAFMDYLKEHDGYYGDFQRYQHFGLSPLLWAIDYGAQKLENMLGYFNFDASEFDVLFMIMQEFEMLAAKHDFKMSYVYLPTYRAFGTSMVWQQMPDYYAQRLEILQAPNQWSTDGFNVIGVRESLRQAEQQIPDFFQGDMYHFSGQGNQIIARDIYRNLSPLL